MSILYVDTYLAEVEGDAKLIPIQEKPVGHFLSVKINSLPNTH